MVDFGSISTPTMSTTLSYDDDLGAWTAADSMSFGDRYHLLVREGFVTETVNFVQRESALEARVDAAASRALPQGWTLITNVRIDAWPKHSPPAGLAGLVPAGAGPGSGYWVAFP